VDRRNKYAITDEYKAIAAAEGGGDNLREELPADG
jgi:hypothetical protein